MIRLSNGYGIVSSDRSFTLVQDFIRNCKDGSTEEARKTLSYHTTLSSALSAYCNNMMLDKVAERDYSLHEVKQVLCELKEEIGRYSV